MIQLKLVYQEKVRKFQLSEENLFATVQSLVKGMIEDKFIPTLLYLDEDEDWITISTETDLFLCLQTMVKPKIHILKSNDKKNIDANERDDGQWERQTGRSMTDTSVKAVNGDHDDFKVEVSNPKTELANEVQMTQEDNAFSVDSFIDWNALVEDLLARTSDQLLNFVKEVAEYVKSKHDLKTIVSNIISVFPCKDHLFFQKSIIDFEKMLETLTLDNLRKFFSQLGKDGLEVAVPLFLRRYAKMKVDENNGAGPALPQMVSWYEAVVANGKEAIFEFGPVMHDRESDQFGKVPDEAKLGNANTAAIHERVRCDSCKTVPIIGTRYKCMTCLNFDLCESCRTGNHPPEHPLIALQAPVPQRGYKLGGGHLEGATEFLMPGWNQCKKGATTEQKEKPEHVHFSGHYYNRGPGFRGRGPGFRGRGRRRHCGGWRHGAAPPFGYPHNMIRPFRYRPEPQLPEDFDDSDTSSSSTGSEDIDEKAKNKLSGKKLKKQQRKLKKKQRKVRHKINKLLQSQGQIEHRINKLQQKERHIMNKIAKLTGCADIELDQNPIQMPQNNPGHDPNPNTRPFKHNLWGSGRSGLNVTLSPVTHVSTQPSLVVATPQRNDDNILTESAYKYPAQLQMLLEMGFEDITTCKKLLDEVNGDINEVAERIGRVPYV